MSGLKVAALVATIVAAFSGATTLIRSWRKDRKEEKGQTEKQVVADATSLEVVLKEGGPRVQSEYDRDFARLGEVFGRGDGMPVSFNPWER
ncbi:hypothetical protein H2199_000242 [Coniosporium tulheliwenetii]|uniref:Uncharacterized protein n=1 Tax=Coniosporium tulheliwenetii TaxID=3383036 RepID=A0ACC2ZPM0_9PEZI|nr:hypothetical protein H2199_000242 [Cladosporium sp. JES 115]